MGDTLENIKKKINYLFSSLKKSQQYQVLRYINPDKTKKEISDMLKKEKPIETIFDFEREKAIQENQAEMVMNMYADKVPIEKIMQYTGLTEDQIDEKMKKIKIVKDK